MSCQKEADADTNGISATQLNKVIFMKYLSTGVKQIWVCNYDGTGAAQVNIILPTGISYLYGILPMMSPDGQKIFFTAGPTTDEKNHLASAGDLYSCNSDGTGITLIASASGGQIVLGGAY